MHVLVAHHDPWARWLLTAALESAGCTVEHASNGMSALRLASESAPDLAVLAAELPEIAARDLADALHAQPQTRGTGVLVLNSTPEQSSAAEIILREGRKQRNQRAAVASNRSVNASACGEWPFVATTGRSSSRIRNGGRSGKWLFSSGIDTL
jgi:CheY-like chemotaxis protein